MSDETRDEAIKKMLDPDKMRAGAFKMGLSGKDAERFANEIEEMLSRSKLAVPVPGRSIHDLRGERHKFFEEVKRAVESAPKPAITGITGIMDDGADPSTYGSITRTITPPAIGYRHTSKGWVTDDSYEENESRLAREAHPCQDPAVTHSGGCQFKRCAYRLGWADPNVPPPRYQDYECRCSCRDRVKQATEDHSIAEHALEVLTRP